MQSDNRLLFGPVAAALLGVGIFVLPFWIPGYAQIQQTVSEIGETDSPMRIPFTILLCVVAACLLIAGVAAASTRQPVISAAGR
jgi:hypothetical protein